MLPINVQNNAPLPPNAVQQNILGLPTRPVVRMVDARWILVTEEELTRFCERNLGNRVTIFSRASRYGFAPCIRTLLTAKICSVELCKSRELSDCPRSLCLSSWLLCCCPIDLPSLDETQQVQAELSIYFPTFSCRWRELRSESWYVVYSMLLHTFVVHTIGSCTCPRGALGDCAHSIAALAEFCDSVKNDFLYLNRINVGKKTPHDLSCEFLLSLKVTGIGKKPPVGWGIVENGPDGAAVKDVSEIVLPESSDALTKMTCEELKQQLRLYSARGLMRKNGKKITYSGLRKEGLIDLVKEIMEVDAAANADSEWNSEEDEFDKGDY